MLANEVPVYICVPYGYTRMVKIRKDDQCSALQKFFKEQMDLVYNGQILNMESTFGSYNINAGDPIVAIAKEKSGQERQNWLNVTNDSEVFSRAVKTMMSKNKKDLFCKLDLAASKLELQPKAYRKLLSRYQNEYSHHHTPTSVSATVITRIGEVLGKDPLPVPWS